MWSLRMLAPTPSPPSMTWDRPHALPSSLSKVDSRSVVFLLPLIIAATQPWTYHTVQSIEEIGVRNAPANALP